MGSRPFSIMKIGTLLAKGVTKACLRCLKEGDSLDRINDTIIALIPKVQHATCMSNFRPINLCNVTYMIVAKALANRLHLVIREVISESYRAFIPGLSSMINVAVDRNMMLGFKCNRRWPTISHLFFTDDSLLFSTASTEDCRVICDILNAYAKGSGQLVDCHEKYLGLPSFTGSEIKELFASVKE
ncbi:hypothetical protein Dsin_019013 [Dipteronia sinensis]|uniref:Reverse transcriptase n=1 Tax=Dipteronia sinensis TaxID=43782 RepID=A0AAE0A6Y4_9ROSI|nr:hypothetical protein Dsin_019013 [Dipteronia sinensis]